MKKMKRAVTTLSLFAIALLSSCGGEPVTTNPSTTATTNTGDTGTGTTSTDTIEESEMIRDTILPKMCELRVPCDEAEVLTAKRCWPFPTYADLLFGTKQMMGDRCQVPGIRGNFCVKQKNLQPDGK